MTGSISRRRALATAGLVGAGLIAAACTPAVAGAPAATPTAQPAVSPAAIPAASPVSGAAALPRPAPTAGGPAPTVVGAVAAVSPTAAQVAATVTIGADRSFSPSQVSVSRGQTVQWRNQSRSPQTVTFNPALATDPSLVSLPAGAAPFDSGVLNPNAVYSHTFDTPGDYQYVSLPYEALQMVGRISVGT